MRGAPFPVLTGLAAALLAIGSPSAHAVAVTPQVTVSFGFCTACTLPTFEAPSAPLPLPGSIPVPNNPHNLLTFGDGTIQLSMNGAVATGFCCVNPSLYPGHNFNGYQMRFSQDAAITGASLLSYAPSGLRPEVTWTADTIYLNMWGGQVNLDWPVLIGYTTMPVPEPAHGLLLGAGLAGIAFAGRRRPG